MKPSKTGFRAALLALGLVLLAVPPCYAVGPTIVTVAPLNGSTAGGTPVIINGNNFTGVTSVTFGGTSATFNVLSPVQINATAPAHAAGTVTVSVTTTGGTANWTTPGFTYVTPAPTVTGVAPVSGSTNGGTSVTITGTNFTGATGVTFGGIAATGISVVNATTITATTPAHPPGPVNVAVTTPGGTGLAAGAFSYFPLAPTVSAVSPASGSAAGGTSVTITGTDFIGATAVTFGGNPATGVSVVNATTITASTPSGNAGAVDVAVTTPNGTGIGPGVFSYLALVPTVTAPTVADVSGTTATLGGTVGSDGGDAISERGVVYAPTATNNDPEIGGSGVVQIGASGTTGTFTVPVTGLAPATGYRFKAYATNSVGTAYSTVTAFTTPSANANLADLVVSGGTLSPAFTPAGASYTVQVPNTTASLTLTPTAAQADASIRVNGVPVASGAASESIPLLPGGNTLTTQVTAQDGATVRTYTVTVTRDSVLLATYQSASDVPVTAAGWTATGSTVQFTLNFAPATGTRLTVIRNTGLAFLEGAFGNLAQGQTVALTYNGTTYQFVANYYGGTGNDLELVWPGTRPYAWGLNSNGALGDNSTTDSTVPVEVTTSGVLAGKTVLKVSGGAFHSAALCSDGTLAAWGWNRDGQLGDNSTTQSTVPVAVDQTGVLAGKTVVALAVGANHNLALCSDGTLAAWGLNSYGVLGDGTTVRRTAPVLVDMSGVLAGKTVVAVAAGQGQSLALCSDGTLAAWGNNFNGQLGNNSNLNSAVPVAVDRTGVLAGKTVVGLASGYAHCLVLCSDGSAAAWGYNGKGQLGDGTLADSPVPVAVITSGVLAGRTVAALSAGDSHSVALCADGTVAAWGWNSNGQLGNNSTIDSPVPVAVDRTGLLAGKTVGSAFAGRLQGLVLCSDGTAATWGWNLVGQLGNGSTTDSPVPVAVATATLAPGERIIGLFSGCESAHGLALVAPPAITSATVTTPTAASITASTALLGGTVTSDGGGAINSRGVVYAPTAVNANPQLGGAGVLSAPGSGTLGAFDVPVTNLTPGTAYTFASYATNSAGTAYSANGTFTTLTAVEYWRQTWYGSAANSGNGADTADPYRTGLPNLLVFAFLGPAQDPALAQVSQLPRAIFAGGNLTFSFTAPSGVSGIAYGAEWCPALELGNWQPVTDTGVGGQHVFSVPIAGPARVFLRLKVTSP